MATSPNDTSNHDPDHPIAPDPIIPVAPVPPGAQATAEQRRDYYAAVNAYNYAVLEPQKIAACHAQAAAQAGNGDAIRYAADKDGEPRVHRHETAPMKRAQLVQGFVQSMPQVTGLTDLAVVDLADRLVDALLKRYPDLLG